MDKRLDSADRKILLELEKNCRIVDSKLSAIVKKPKDTVRTKIARMEKEGLIAGYTVYLNMAKLGMLGYKAYFQIKKTEKERTAFCEYLKTRTDVIWVGEGDGKWDVGATFFANSPEEFYVEKNRIFEKFRGVILSYTVGSLVKICSFGNKFLDTESVNPKTEIAVPFGGYECLKIDSVDKEIVEYLLENGRVGIVDLTKKCKGDVETIRGRMKQLENNGLISAYVANLNLEKLNISIYKAFVCFGGLTPEIEERFYKYCKTHPNITAFVRVVAQWDIEIEISAHNYEEYTIIANQIKQEFCEALVSVEFMIVDKNELYPARQRMFISK